jgi:hypothetical protein
MSTPCWSVIDSQESLDELISLFDWHDAFIREAHVASPSFRVAGCTANAERPACARVLVASGIETKPALELLFDKTYHFHLPMYSDLNPRGEYREWKCYWSFGFPNKFIHCERIKYRILENSCVGQQLYYAKEQVFEDGLDPIV